MKCLTIVFQSSYALLTLCLSAAGYIYVVHGLGGDSVMGVLALGITGVLAVMLYRLGVWFVREALPQLKRIYARHRKIRATAKAAKANAPVSVEDSVWEKLPPTRITSSKSIFRRWKSSGCWRCSKICA